MPRVRVEVRGTKEILAKIRTLQLVAPTLMGRALFTSSMRILVPAMRRRLRTNKSIFRGVLSQSIGAKVEASPGKGKASVIVGTFNDFPSYTINIERGSRRHKPTKEEEARLKDWVRVKLGKSGDLGEQILAGVIKGITEKGTKKKPFIVPVFKEKRKLFTKDFFGRLRVQLGLRAK